MLETKEEILKEIERLEKELKRDITLTEIQRSNRRDAIELFKEKYDELCR